MKRNCIIYLVHIPIPSLIMNALNKLRVQLICVANKVDTSVEYANLRHNQHLQKVQVLPEDPRPPGVSWYDYLHPSSTQSERITASSFVKDVLVPNHLLMDHAYDGWLIDQTNSKPVPIPSTQNIEDGFFGKDIAYNTFRTLVNTFYTPTNGQSMR